ncbi:alpha-mannosidase [Carnobacterium maltaromaticum]|uniref:glycoside hydrolase family 38 N-terminal domain-containing protein n=1 Tax=Carnobacterium maltaromaticum TaxID=2751 RepID=UPI00070502EB|nr:glycoside hydrolase family 38 C-terminal domain-containing protein [Carnobacterium maltaromaticum]KRN85155.1 alpha-mannosidase (GH38) [Carnobacterium maltaromaticum]MDT1945603.1 alpha-mannosidase [Carnobacterium maltaromaticum]MDT2000107.1 alpha-mannosidase [Carnobacterium maltaromaticum]TFJ29398.1 alpha-mannosidase [Carnobacterium maltaromaticum]TFJ33568.1 alpha-mannosidase [Carnobacterium maltaromaticum]
MKKIHVVAHTHWDREWYFSDNEAFIQFSYHMDEVIYALENGELDYYYLDGQLSILDDYLKVYPNQETKIKELVEGNKLFIGPWYTQMDEFVVAGESVVKNLQIGIDMSKRLGGHTALGYLPDSFGQGKDMPKIYNGFGIEDAVFWRGMPNEVTKSREFYWTAEDGSKVLTINIRNGYYAGVALVEGEIYQKKAILDIVSEDSATTNITLPVGGDQRAVDRNLKAIIEEANKEFAEEYQIEESNYPHIFNLLKKEATDLPTVQGEFMSGSVSKIHRSIYSSRYDLKKINDTIENRLIFQLEPLMLMADDLGIPFKRELMDYTWKLILKNHAHDSIGGCNTDKTNEMIMARYKEADQLSYSTVDYLVRKIAESIEGIQENDLVLFNTLPYRRTEPYTLEVSTKKTTIKLFDDQRHEIPFQLISTEKVYAGEVRRSESDYDEAKYYYIHKISFINELPALSYQIVSVEEQDESATQEKPVAPEETMIENAAYKITFSNGQFSILAKEQGITYKNCLHVEESGDEGDTYDYSPAYFDSIHHLFFETAEVAIQSGKFLSTMSVTGSWFVPKDLAARKAQKVDTEIEYTLTLSLKNDSKRVDMKLSVNNQALDHRMRLVVKTPVKSQVSYADTLFGIVERNNNDPHIHDWRELGWKEEPTEIYPMIHYANTHDLETSWTVMSKGIKEYQVIDSDMYITLFRGVGFLGRPELLRRPGDASGNQFRYIPTPDSQLLGSLEMELSLIIATDYNPAEIQREYQMYSVDTPYYQVQTLNRFTNPIQYFQSNKVDHLTTLKKSLDLSELPLVFSAIELSRDGEWVNIRLYNPLLEETVKAEIIPLATQAHVRFVNLNGDLITSLGLINEIPLGDFKPGQIKTISIKR